MSHRLSAYDPQLEIFEGEQASSPPRRGEGLSELQEMEFAAEMLELQGTGSLARFVGRLARHVGHDMGQAPAPATTDAVVRLLAGLLQRAIPRQPAAGGGAGTMIAPTLGDRLADISDHQLGLELEGLSEEDRDFETARQLVRFIADAAGRALSASPADPRRAAQAAAFAAARQYAPGLLPGGRTAAAPRAGMLQSRNAMLNRRRT